MAAVRGEGCAMTLGDNPGGGGGTEEKEKEPPELLLRLRCTSAAFSGEISDGYMLSGAAWVEI